MVFSQARNGFIWSSSVGVHGDFAGVSTRGLLFDRESVHLVATDRR